MRYLPNTITFIRILMTPIVLVLLLGTSVASLFWALVLFVAASLSDYLDGKLARTLQVRSRLGQFLDPLADKVLVVGTFAVLAYRYPDLVPWWVVAIIVLRDVFVTGLRSWAEARGRSLRTTALAKAKTVVQLVFLIVLMLALLLGRLGGWTGETATWLLDSGIIYGLAVAVALFTLLTGVSYAFSMDYSKSPER